MNVLFNTLFEISNFRRPFNRFKYCASLSSGRILIRKCPIIKVFGLEVWINLENLVYDGNHCHKVKVFCLKALVGTFHVDWISQPAGYILTSTNFSDHNSNISAIFPEFKIEARKGDYFYWVLELPIFQPKDTFYPEHFLSNVIWSQDSQITVSSHSWNDSFDIL